MRSYGHPRGVQRVQKIFAWDFHGTLEQGTDVGFFEILRELSVQIKYEVNIELSEVRKLYGISIIDYLKHFFPKLADGEIIELREKIRTIQNREHIKKHIRAVPYAHDVLSSIKNAGHKNIIVSTSNQQHIKRFLKVVELTKYFDEIFGVDRHSFDGEFDIASEKATAIKSFAKKHGFTSKNIVVIGDRPGDVDAGLLLGAKTYQYVNPDYPNIKTRAHEKIHDLRKILVEI